MNNIRAFLRWFIYRYRHLTKVSLWILTIPCLTIFLIFTIVLYLNLHHIFTFYSHLHSSTVIQMSQLEKTKISNLSENNVHEKRGLSMYDRNITYNDYNYLNSDTLTYEKRTYFNDIEILFRLPKKVSISALLLIFHGCRRSAHDWFHTIERQRIVGAAMDLGYGCLAFQTTDQFSKCWSSDTDIVQNDDIKMVFKGLEGFYKEYPKLESLPRFTFGASSGGIFSSIFVTNKRYKIQGQILFISFVSPYILQKNVKAKSYPPTAWIYMLRDTQFASETRINESIKIFIQEKIPCIAFNIEPISLTSTIFHERIPTITIDVSNYIFHNFQQNQWLDSQNYLIYNPRHEDTWKTFLFKSLDKTNKNIFNNLNQHKDIITEFLNTIYGEHEISFERSYEALKWHKNIYNNSTI